MAKIKLIHIETVLEMTVNNEPFKLVDVLSEESFKKGHIPGAVNVPLDQLEEKAPSLFDKNDTIVVYCASYHCRASTKAAEKLLAMGYGKTLDFKAGKKGWADSGLELDA